MEGKCGGSDKVITVPGQRVPEAPDARERHSVATFSLLDWHSFDLRPKGTGKNCLHNQPWTSPRINGR